MNTDDLTDTNSDTTKTLVNVAVISAAAIGFTWGAKKAGKALVRKFKKTEEETN